ncbi:MAG: outer membrane protein assembly factor BamA, partial [Rhodospirillales bacterium]|nr:outer membrane protein assembly factor BamA [Rhodospirillales bacterium]
QLRRSRQRINNLNFFEKVSVEQTPGSQPDKTVIKVDVEEKSTGSLSVGAGFSTTNGALLDMNVRERNLLGRGQDLRLSFVLAQRRSQIDLGFTEPYFLGREISAGFDVFHTTTDFQNSSSFDSRVTGGDLRAGYRITEDLSQNWKYTVKKSEIRNVDSGASIYIRASEGKRTLSEISHVLTYDKRNSIIRPTEGYYLRMTNDIAGLGGTTNYIRNRFDAGKYYPITDQWILSLKGSGGYIFGINQDVHILDRFFLGGDDLRGFASGGVGPRDSATSDALGGEWMYSATAELSFPLGLPDDLGVSGKIFSDLGSSGKISPSGSTVVDTGSVRVSLGAGVTWISPFGPIGVDFGFPIVYEDFDQIENIRINFGTRF